jgi:hypothetical protein
MEKYTDTKLLYISAKYAAIKLAEKNDSLIANFDERFNELKFIIEEERAERMKLEQTIEEERAERKKLERKFEDERNRIVAVLEDLRYKKNNKLIKSCKPLSHLDY